MSTDDLEVLRAKIIANATGIADAAGQRALANVNKQRRWVDTNAKPMAIGGAAVAVLWALVHFVL